MSQNSTASPKTRDLAKLIESLDITGTELSFQVMRLNEHVKPRTTEEKEYHETLKAGYEQAAYYVRLLKKYHEGRLERQTGPNESADSKDAIVGGKATPYLDDSQSPV